MLLAVPKIVPLICLDVCMYEREKEGCNKNKDKDVQVTKWRCRDVTNVCEKQNLLLHSAEIK